MIIKVWDYLYDFGVEDNFFLRERASTIGGEGAEGEEKENILN